MKRMTLLTALALVFSLFAVTAAIAAPGLGAGEGDQDRDCRVVEDEVSDCVPVQDRLMNKTSVPDEEQPQTEAQVQNQNQNRNQIQDQVDECETDQCEADEALNLQERYQLQLRERLTVRIIEMLGAEGEEVDGQYRVILNLMLNFWSRNLLTFMAL